MNRLSVEQRARILGCLVEGNSMRATSRMTGVSINTVTKFLVDLGTACGLYQNEAFRKLKCKRIQCDEIWSFCYKKQKNVRPWSKGVLGQGDGLRLIPIPSFLPFVSDIDYGRVTDI